MALSGLYARLFHAILVQI